MKIKRYIIIAAILLFVFIVGFFIYHNIERIKLIISPFLFSIIIVYLINPLVKKLEKRKINKSLSIIMIYFVLSILLIVVIIFIIPELINNTREFGNKLPEIVVKYQNSFDKIMSFVKTSNYSEEVKQALIGEIETVTDNLQKIILENLKSYVTKAISGIYFIFNVMIAFVIAYYIIKDERMFKESILSLTPRRWRGGIVSIGREINEVLKNFINGQIITAIIIGILETIGLYLIKVKYPLVLGLIGGIANIIPYFGPILGGIPAVAIAMIDSPAKALWTVIVFSIIQQIDNVLISPKIIEGKLGLHPVTTIIAVIIGGEFYGIIGMLISVPIAAMIKIIVRRSVEAIV